jgi:hypothetical protein
VRIIPWDSKCWLKIIGIVQDSSDYTQIFEKKFTQIEKGKKKKKRILLMPLFKKKDLARKAGGDESISILMCYELVQELLTPCENYIKLWIPTSYFSR